MHRQVQVLTEALMDKGWELKYSEKPVTKSYWWVNSFLHFRRGEKRFVLTLLVHPLEENRAKPIWAVSATEQEPLQRLEAERTGEVLTTGHDWAKRLPGWLLRVEERFG